jgi:hypothetical protein
VGLSIKGIEKGHPQIQKGPLRFRRGRKGPVPTLGEPWEARLDDFCTAHFSGSATEVVRAALDMFIPGELARDLATAERFERLQADRRAKDQSDAEENKTER